MASPYSILIDNETSIVLVAGLRPYLIEFLRESSPDNLRHIAFAQFPNYTESLFLRRVPLKELSSWTWEESDRLFVPTKESLITDAIKERSLLCVEKYRVLCRLVNNLNILREPADAGVSLQGMVYFSKRLEAQRFKSAGYPEESIEAYPYVDQYAYFMHISPEQAADDILFSAKLTQELLLQSEKLRLKYFNRVKKTYTHEDVLSVWKDYSTEVRRGVLQ
jgi:hypothetical protein